MMLRTSGNMPANKKQQSHSRESTLLFFISYMLAGTTTSLIKR